ncbi:MULTISPECIES: rod shape-determining protein MreC [unclassified Helicobacter]|uniref:rod shape-determining protein MreC n=1 Tax=unclassified Helicobacter TaxID=2593540 RepID=UPI000CF04E83|nr:MULTISPECIES: rod shape-determining protein MreC [unclassified Helicobacter]
MRYRSLFLILFFIFYFAIVFVFSQGVRDKFFKVTGAIKMQYLEFSQSLGKNYDRFFNQAKSIAFLQEKYKEYQKIELELLETKKRLEQVFEFVPQLDLYPKVTFEPALVISYVDFLEYDKVWLHTKMPYQNNKIFGIVQDGYALGIAVVDKDRLVGLFNGNEQCGYSVYIGKDKIPATLHYNPQNKETVLADFIPQYFSIQAGDQVFTSGLDNIFVQDIPVGVVVEVVDKNGYITAVVKPYADIKSPKYLWLINKENIDAQ